MAQGKADSSTASTPSRPPHSQHTARSSAATAAGQATLPAASALTLGADAADTTPVPQQAAPGPSSLGPAHLPELRMRAPSDADAMAPQNPPDSPSLGQGAPQSAEGRQLPGSPTSARSPKKSVRPAVGSSSMADTAAGDADPSPVPEQACPLLRIMTWQGEEIASDALALSSFAACHPSGARLHGMECAAAWLHPAAAAVQELHLLNIHAVATCAGQGLQ